ncbi:Ldh family oxidoreductase [Halovivax sp.]|uniref:Ldh family oxidoreductase n=1 Tax=Halovivax sp. TaxID=1935978 RepID=UPI0025C33DFA|nr:Ldh family oxidoreductase [Halovivax sp.]
MTDTGTHSRGSRYRLDHGELEEFVFGVLRSAGVDREPAATIAEALVRADLRGVDSHGVARLPAYVRNVEAGGFEPSPAVTVDRSTDSVFLVDADGGPGQHAGAVAMERLIETVDETGVSLAAVSNSNHFGTAAYYTERAAERGYIGIAMTNVGPDVIPFGGRNPFFGTNPLSVSVPTDRDFSITLDMATSVVAMGKIDHVAKAQNAEIPAEWAVDEHGEPTTDPHEVAALRPVGGPKGYGLALIVDVLCGLLSGAGPSPSVGPLYGDYDEPMDLGHFFGVIDVSAFRDPAAFAVDVGDLVDALKAQQTADGTDEIMLPGEIETRTMERRRSSGVPVSESVYDDLRGLGERYEVALPDGR